MNQVPESFDRYFRISVRYRRIFFKITKSTDATIFLSQAWFWWEHSNYPNGMFWKTRRQWEKETGLTRWQQEAARKILVDLGFLHEPKMGKGKPRQYIVMVQTVLDAITKFSEDTGELCRKEFPEIDSKDKKISPFKARHLKRKVGGVAT